MLGKVLGDGTDLRALGREGTRNLYQGSTWEVAQQGQTCISERLLPGIAHTTAVGQVLGCSLWKDFSARDTFLLGPLYWRVSESTPLWSHLH